MVRVAIAILWLMAAGSAHAAYMKGTLKFDDGRTARLSLRSFRWTGSWNEGNRAAVVHCRGDACFAARAFLNLFYHPTEYDLNFGEVNVAATGGQGRVVCGTLDPVKVPRFCRIASRVVCNFRGLDDTLTRGIATGMLDLHRTAPSCQRALRRAAQ